MLVWVVLGVVGYFAYCAVAGRSEDGGVVQIPDGQLGSRGRPYPNADDAHTAALRFVNTQIWYMRNGFLESETYVPGPGH